MKYRLLKIGEIIKRGDEYLCEDAETWKNVLGLWVGAHYEHGSIVRTMRRPIEGDPAPEQKGLPVRIAVAVDPETGEWSSAGWDRNRGSSTLKVNDNHKVSLAIDRLGLRKKHQISWVEAVIPITDPPVIVGRVEKEGE